jgi:hypothetical protein
MRLPLLATLLATLVLPSAATAEVALDVMPSGQHEPGVGWATVSR